MKKLLITGFEPFGGAGSNPSWDAVNELPDVCGGFELTKVLVPVVFGKAGEKVSTVYETVKPDVVILVGMAAGRECITPEYVAVNLRHAEIPDNEGNVYRAAPVVEDGPDAYFTGLPVFDMVDKLKENGIPSAVSFSAGTYVCNDLFYSMCHKYGNDVPIGFVHVPSSMPVEDIAKGLKVLIESI